MTRAPTYPIHRNRRNSISIRFSVRSIRFSRCGPGPVGPRPPASLALGGKEIHYPPRGAESRGSFRSTGPPQPGGWGRKATAGAARGSQAAPPRRGGALRDGDDERSTRTRRESRGRTGAQAAPRQGGTQRDGQTQRCAIRIVERIGGSAFPLARRQGNQKLHIHSAGRLDRVPHANESTQCSYDKRRRLPVRRQPPFR